MSQFPNDKSTVFSICPFAVNEFKPGLYPGHFIIPGCLDDTKPERIVCGSSDHLVSVAGRKESLRVTTPSFEVARSVVVDFLDGQLFSTPDSHPGIMWLQGDISLDEFKSKHADKYKQMKDSQRAWFVLVVKKTQDDWNRYHTSRVVTDIARFAVRALGMEIPEWMSVDQMGKEPLRCPACGTINDPNNAWCVNCITGGIKVIINVSKAKTLQLA